MKTKNAFVGVGKCIGESAKSTFRRVVMAPANHEKVPSAQLKCTNRQESGAILSADFEPGLLGPGARFQAGVPRTGLTSLKLLE